MKSIPDNTKLKIRKLLDKGWNSKRIQRRYRSYTVHQIAGVRGWMTRGKY